MNADNGGHGGNGMTTEKQRNGETEGAMSRPLLKFSGGSVNDYATFSTAGFSQLINHGIPKRSTTMPNRSAQKVSSMGI